MSLPPEICGLVCQDAVLGRGDLRALCAVSRSFRDEAERLLYTSVHLNNLRHIKSWCLSLVRRPHLPPRVHSVSFTMPSPAVLTPADMSKIMRALHACSGLRELEVLRDRSMPVGDSIQSWVLEGHTFKLSKFTNTYFDAHSLVGFLVQQSGIRTLVLKSSPTSSLPASILPNLTTIDTFAAIIRQIGNSAWEQDRSLQHMQYQMSHSFDDEELSTFVTLSRFSDTLTSLSIHRVSGGLGLDIAIVAACVAAQLPELKFFQFLDDTQSVSPRTLSRPAAR